MRGTGKESGKEFCWYVKLPIFNACMFLNIGDCYMSVHYVSFWLTFRVSSPSTEKLGNLSVKLDPAI